MCTQKLGQQNQSLQQQHQQQQCHKLHQKHYPHNYTQYIIYLKASFLRSCRQGASGMLDNTIVTRIITAEDDELVEEHIRVEGPS